MNQFRLRSFLIAISLLAVGIAFGTFNVRAYQHTRLLEHQFRRSLTEVRPWIWPEGALALFMLAWVCIFIVCTVAVFRTRNQLLRCEAAFFAAVALIACVVNAYFGMLEAFHF